MRLKHHLALAAVALCPVTAAFSQKYEGVIDKTVAQIGNSAILLSEVEGEAYYMQYYGGYESVQNIRCEVLENMMITKLFYTQAQLDSLTVNPDMVEAMLNQRMAQVLSEAGGEAEVEKQAGKPLHKLREEWRQLFMEQNLAGEMQRTVAGKAGEATPKEVERFYRRTSKDSLPVIPTQYRYSQIVLYPDVERASLEVRERLLEFRQRVMEGEKFSLLATLYSEDVQSAMRGGELGMTSKSIFWPAFSDAAMTLKPGQVSPIVETPDGFHLIQLIDRKGDMFNARHILLRPRYTEQDRDSAFVRLDSIRNAVLADSITFEQAARKFSEDPSTRTNGGLVADLQSGAPYVAVDMLKPAEYAVLRNMKEGEISAPMVSTDNEGRTGNTVYKILKLEKVVPSHVPTYNDDFNVLQNMATNQKAQDAVEAFIREKIATTYIVIDPIFQKCVFKRDGWLK